MPYTKSLYSTVSNLLQRLFSVGGFNIKAMTKINGIIQQYM